MPILEYLLRGIKSLQAKQGITPSNPLLPITPTLLRKLCAVWSLQPKNPDYIMLWAACPTCFSVF